MALQFRRVSDDPNAALEIRRIDGEQRRADRQVDAELRRMEVEQRRADEAADRAAKKQRRREAAEQRAAAKQARQAALRRVADILGRRSVFVVPLLFITGFAVFGQIGYGYDNYTPPGADHAYRLAVAIGAAIAIESISNYVQWLSHRARINRASAMAARLARWSYLIALGVAGINYAHFATPDLSPTPGAFVFAAFSLCSPWLWGLYTRGVEQEKRAAEGTLDCRGAVFSTERWRQFPILTWRARRYSILRNIDTPVEAWDAFMVEHQRIKANRRIERRQTAARRSDTRSARRADRDARQRDASTGGPTPGPDHGMGGGPSTLTGSGPDHGLAAGPTPVRSGPVGMSRSARTMVSRLPQTVVELAPEEQTALRDLATDWAAAQDAVPGWRRIHGAVDDNGRQMFPGISTHGAKEAARLARARRGWPTDEAAAQ